MSQKLKSSVTKGNDLEAVENSQERRGGILGYIRGAGFARGLGRRDGLDVVMGAEGDFHPT